MATKPNELPTIKIAGKTYFVDVRLRELRNTNNPHDRRELCSQCRDLPYDEAVKCKYFCDPYNTDGDCLMLK